MNDQLSLIVQNAGEVSVSFAVFAVTFFIWISIELLLIVRGRRYSPETGDSSSILLLLLMIEAMLIAYVFSGIEIGYLPGGSDVHFSIGTAIMWAGMFLRFWAVYTLGGFFSTVITVQRNHRIITAGPYKYVRHPSYTGALLILSGIGVAFGNSIGFLLGMVLVMIGYCYRINVEEKILIASFGSEYSEYAKTKKRLIPFVY